MTAAAHWVGVPPSLAEHQCRNLLRMYVRWSKRYKVELWTCTEAGIKALYGYLKSEKDCSSFSTDFPFCASGPSSATSFAAINVSTNDDNVEIDIAMNIQLFSTQKTGNNINKTDSAVRMIHVPQEMIVQSPTFSD